VKYADVIHRCFRCGYCKFTSDYRDLNCPPYKKFRFESYSPGGRMWLISAWLKGEVKWTERLGEIMYSCTTCGNCVEECVFKFKDYLVEIIVEARQEIAEQGLAPPPVRDCLKSIRLYGNPYKAPPEERGSWARECGIKEYDGNEYLFYAGDAGSYDERGKKIACAAGELMVRAGLSVGILGEKEISDGNEVRVLGEDGLFEYLARTNIERFRQAGVKKVIALSPHSFHVFKNEYPKLGADFEVMHFSSLLLNLIRDKKIVPKRYNAVVTYHDPCYLGRHNGEYSTPRKVLQAIPGVRLVEMGKNRKNALCCGGGGGNFFTDVLGGGEESPAVVRVREAVSTGAEVLAVACPKCARMFTDAVNFAGYKDKIKVKDISELLVGSLEG